MILEVSSLHLQSLGLPESAAKRSALLNHNIHRHVKTKAGITKDHYRHKPGVKYNEKDKARPHPPRTGCSRFPHFSEHYIN
eukprot:2968655-Ditylum_brightwellii.AAC.1